MLLKIHTEFNNEYGFTEIKPNLFQIKDYQDELEELLKIGEDFRASTKTILTEKSIVIQKLYNTLIFQARSIMKNAHKDAVAWGENVLSPIRHQIMDHKKQIDNRLAVLRSAGKSEGDLSNNIIRLGKELEVLTTQRNELKIIIKAIQQASEIKDVT